jgi:hypothetical protein
MRSSHAQLSRAKLDLIRYTYEAFGLSDMSPASYAVAIAARNEDILGEYLDFTVSTRGLSGKLNGAATDPAFFPAWFYRRRHWVAGTEYSVSFGSTFKYDGKVEQTSSVINQGLRKLADGKVERVEELARGRVVVRMRGGLRFERLPTFVRIVTSDTVAHAFCGGNADSVTKANAWLREALAGAALMLERHVDTLEWVAPQRSLLGRLRTRERHGRAMLARCTAVFDLKPLYNANDEAAINELLDEAAKAHSLRIDRNLWWNSWKKSCDATPLWNQVIG